MISNHSEIERCVREIESRSLAAQGFGEQPGGTYRPDSTAWAVVALSKAGSETPSIGAGRAALAAGQLPDGRISFPGMRDVFWPTSLAILAWHHVSQFENSQDCALQFLLQTTGRHWKRGANDPAAHDTSIKGWPWVAGSHSFVEPTAMTLLAFETMGQTAHPRFQAGLRMIMDRQLPHGGWNYGNTLVYGKELYPFVDMTGIALTSLAGHVSKAEIMRSILYLRIEAEKCRTPLSLAWALFGLGAWGEFPKEGIAWIEETLKKQQKYGPYGTSLLSMLALAFYCHGDFRKCTA